MSGTGLVPIMLSISSKTSGVNLSKTLIAPTISLNYSSLEDPVIAVDTSLFFNTQAIAN